MTLLSFCYVWWKLLTVFIVFLLCSGDTADSVWSLFLYLGDNVNSVHSLLFYVRGMLLTVLVLFFMFWG